MALKTKYSPLQKFSFDNLFLAYGESSSRNKTIILAIVAIALVLVLFLPLSLVFRKVDSLKKEIAKAEKGYSQVLDKIAVYEKIKREMEVLEKKFGSGAGGSLTTRIEGIARDSGLTVDQMKEKAPQETDYLEINSIEIKLSNVGLSQLLDFFNKIENDPTAPMRVRKVQIKPKSNNRQLLTVSCDVATFTLKKEI